MEESRWMCPACGDFIKEEHCECGFYFSEVLVCPKKDKDNICLEIKSKCSKGLSYEECEHLRKGKLS